MFSFLTLLLQFLSDVFLIVCFFEREERTRFLDSVSLFNEKETFDKFHSRHQCENVSLIFSFFSSISVCEDVVCASQ